MQNLNFKNWKKCGEFFKKIPSFWTSKITWIFLIILVISSAYLVYVWYFFVFNSDWSEEKKQEYLNIHGKEVMFDEKKFNGVVDKFSKRKESYNFKSETIKDIFQLK